VSLAFSVEDAAPAAAGRLVFLAGGTLPPEARRFLASQPQPVLEKPLSLELLAAAEQRLYGAPPSPRSTGA
jgi:hypothetical protein